MSMIFISRKIIYIKPMLRLIKYDNLYKLFLFVIFCDFRDHKNCKNLIYALNLLHSMMTCKYVCHRR